MNKDLLRKVQLAQLEIAKEIKRVCEENGIQYFLDSGTLLGAVRHKGFIPWDDDMDIGMLRKDYEKFLQIAPKKLDKKYFLQTPFSDNNYGLFFSKVRKLGTVYIEKASEKSKAHNEIWVDVFPYDTFPDDEKIRKQVIKKITYYRRVLYVKSKIKPWIIKKGVINKFICFLGYLPYRICALFISREKFLETAKMYQIWFNNQKSSYKFPQGSAPCGKWLIPSEVFESFRSILFEDTMFLVPAGYDEYLKAAYGDYMELPPEEQRENRHNIVEVKL